MKIDGPTPMFVETLPELRHFSLILTGDEEAADVALAKALKTALASIATASSFPCYRSWLFAHLLQALRQTTSGTSTNPGITGFIGLLQIPFEERAVLVLTEGLRFDLETTSMITGHSGAEVLRLVTKARTKFLVLAPDYNFDRGRDRVPSLT